MAGTIAGFLAAIFIGYVFFLPHHSNPAPGDGIMLLLLGMILVPAGAISGCIRAVMVYERPEIDT
jgi:hypothetical protein